MIKSATMSQSLHGREVLVPQHEAGVGVATAEAAANNSDNRSNLIYDHDNQPELECQPPAKVPNQSDETSQRRSSIQHILNHPMLNDEQRRHSIQILMDGRRRSSFGATWGEAAKNVAAEFASMDCDSNSSTCSNPDDDDNDNEYNETYNSNNNNYDDKSHCDHHEEELSQQHQQPRQVLQHQQDPSSNDEDSNKDVSEELSNQKISALASTSRDVCSPIMIAYTISGQSTGDPKLMELQRPHCPHYERNCSIISPCCGQIFGCRICHDECENLGQPFMKFIMREEHNSPIMKQRRTNNNNIPQVVTALLTNRNNNLKKLSSLSWSGTPPRKLKLNNNNIIKKMSPRFSLSSVSDIGDDVHHNINRHEIDEIICRKCFKRQPSKT